MARVYYPSDAPYGAIQAELQASLPAFEALLTALAPKQNQAVSIDLSGTSSPYATAQVWEGGFSYAGTYLPRAVIFGDDFSIPYPEHYCLIALVGGVLEACAVAGGPGVGYEDAPKLQRPVAGAQLQAVIAAFEALVATVNSEQPLPVAAPTPRRRYALPSEQVAAYEQLLRLSGWSDDNVAHTVEMLGALKVESLKFGPRNALLDLARERQRLWVYLDHKDTPRDIAWSLERILAQNFGVETKLDAPSGSLYEDYVGAHFNARLRPLGFELLFIVTGSDDYMAALVRTEDRERAIQLYAAVEFEAQPYS